MKERETDSSSNMRRRWTASMPESTATGVSPMAVWEDSEAARGIFREKKTEEGERDLRSEEEEEEWGWRSVVLMLLLNACWLSVTAIKDCAIVFSSWTVLRYLFISRFIIKSRSRGVLSIYGVWRVLTCILEKKIVCVCEFFFLWLCVFVKFLFWLVLHCPANIWLISHQVCQILFCTPFKPQSVLPHWIWGVHAQRATPTGVRVW